MLEHQKIVLRGVSDNTYLFRKELLKSFNWLSKEERSIFEDWVYNTFKDKQPEVVSEFVG